MKQILLASAAALALTFPAMAQNNMQQAGNAMGSANHQQQARAQRVKPSQLSKQQIKQIQMSLNKNGMHASHADGIWGPETATAVRNFQKKQHMNANGHLTKQTLAALGVKIAGQSENAQNHKPSQKGTIGAAPSETTGQGSSMSASPAHSSNAVGQPNQPKENSSQMNSNSAHSRPSNQSGNMSKTKQ